MEEVHYARAGGMGGQSYCFERSEPTGLNNVTANFTRAGNCPCGIANVYLLQPLHAEVDLANCEAWPRRDC